MEARESVFLRIKPSIHNLMDFESYEFLFFEPQNINKIKITFFGCAIKSCLKNN